MARLTTGSGGNISLTREPGAVGVAVEDVTSLARYPLRVHRIRLVGHPDTAVPNEEVLLRFMKALVAGLAIRDDFLLEGCVSSYFDFLRIA